MSELINTQKANNSLHWRLLTSVSSLALLAAICGTQGAFAEDSDRPTVWIELGADLDRVDGGQQAFAPAFVVNNSGSTAFDPISPAEAQKPPSFSFGGEGKLSIEPEGADWVFSASVRYGRSNSNRQVHQTAKNKPVYQHLVFNTPYFPNHTLIAPSNHTPFTANFFAAQEELSESHAVIDFQVGKDLGIGLFGREGMSVLNVGVRFAQFTSRLHSNLQARPDLDLYARHYPNAFPYKSHLYGTLYVQHYHQYVATAQAARSFRGIGPSLSWNASAPFVGNPENGDLSFDLGVNAAILFGRQKASVQHHTSAVYFEAPYVNGYSRYNHPQVNLQRSRSVVVPNVGGSAGVSFNFTNVKVSAGYRGDFFFGAMDTGFDTAKQSTIGFYGPFATVSIGLP